MKTYVVVSHVPLPDVEIGVASVVVASARWDGLAKARKVSIITQDEPVQIQSVVAARAAVDSHEDDAMIITLPPSIEWFDETPPDGTVKDVLQWIETTVDDTERLRRLQKAFEHEQQHKQRTSLLNALREILESADETTADDR